MREATQRARSDQKGEVGCHEEVAEEELAASTAPVDALMQSCVRSGGRRKVGEWKSVGEGRLGKARERPCSGRRLLFWSLAA